MTNRRPMPSPIEVSAKPEAMPIENGFTVEPITPTPAPTRITAAATIRP
jgi:hypothetical protein